MHRACGRRTGDPGRRLFVATQAVRPGLPEAKRIAAAASFLPAHANIIQTTGTMRDPPWLTDVALTGGFMYDTTVHFFDVARFLMGEVTEIRASGRHFSIPSRQFRHTAEVRGRRLRRDNDLRPRLLDLSL